MARPLTLEDLLAAGFRPALPGDGYGPADGPDDPDYLYEPED